MPAACDHSSLAIPNDAGYAPLVGRFAADIALYYNFEVSDAEAVAAAVELAVRSLLDYSFEPNESGSIRIEFDRIAEGLRVRLHDKGLPFGIDGDPGRPGAEPAVFPWPGCKSIWMKSI